MTTSTTRGAWQAILFGLLALGFGITAQAEERELELPITQVQLAPGGAQITRTAAIPLSPGQQSLVISGLPANLDPGEVQLALTGRQSEIRGFTLETQDTGDFTAPAERRLREALQTLQDQRREIHDEAASAALQLKLLDSLASSPESVSASDLATLLRQVALGDAQARSTQRTAERQLRELDADIKRLEHELAKVATGERVQSLIRVQVYVPTQDQGQGNLTIQYPQADAGWRWQYEAWLDSNQNQLRLTRQAAVWQGTGEDWTDVRLTLSTAAVRRDTRPPELQPLFLGLRDPDADRRERAHMMAPDALMSARVSAEAAPAIDADVQRWHERYVLPEPVDIRADRQPHRYQIDARTVDVDVVARTVPSIRTDAWVQASFTYDDSTPVQPGDLRLYRDGAYIGSTALPRVQPDSRVTLPFGIDEGIEVARFQEAEGSGDSGLFGRTRTQESRTRFEITNHTAQPVTVEVVDRIPVARHSDITVEMLPDASEPQTRDLDGQAGLLLWQVQAEPGQTQTIRHQYRIRHPSGQELTYQ